MQWPAILAGRQLAIALRGFGERLLSQDGDDRIEFGAETLEPIETVTREIDRRDLAAPQHSAEVKRPSRTKDRSP